MVHLGRLIQDDKYSSRKDQDQFLGRVLRISKTKYKQLNGFPNTFYGWGGEDDAFARRIGRNVVFRPKESLVGIEMETKNDIFPKKRTDQMEANKVEQLILDNLQWKIDGINSLQYAIEENRAINSRVRKITVQLNPVQHGLVGGAVLRVAEETELLPSDPVEDAHDAVVSDKPPETVTTDAETVPDEQDDTFEAVDEDDTLEPSEVEKIVKL